MNDVDADAPVRFEREYEAAVEDVWALWTTKEGFESWWGPEGFRVKVHAIEPRVGGLLHYDMIAEGEEQIEYMKRSGQPLSHETRGRFAELEPHRRIELVHMIDFIPGLSPYENTMTVDLEQRGETVRMVVTIEPHRSAEMTRMAALGFESQLTKVPAALAGLRRASRPA